MTLYTPFWPLGHKVSLDRVNLLAFDPYIIIYSYHVIEYEASLKKKILPRWNIVSKRSKWCIQGQILGFLTFYWPLTSDLTLRISFICSQPILNYPLVLTLYGIGGVKNEIISPRSNVMFKRLHVIIATFGILKKMCICL